MRSLTIEEVRSAWFSDNAASYAPPDRGALTLTKENFLTYGDNDVHPRLVIRTPPEHRKIVALAYSMLLLPYQEHQELFQGGLLLFNMWEVGSPQMVRPGWKIIESLRRANGDPRPLDIAPSQEFRHDEFVELHAFLIQVMAYGWFAHFIPGTTDYFVEFTTAERIVFTASALPRLESLYSRLKRWDPARED